MTELDYAYLADYASAQDGKLTAVGASFIEITGRLPFSQQIAVAGRIRATDATESISLTVEFDVPGDSPLIEVSGTVTPESADHRYDGKMAVLFTITQPLTFTAEGLASVRISIDGQLARELKFDVRNA